MNDMLSQRQRWFRSFPEGTLEFLLVTRLAIIFLLLALTAFRESQRPMALTVLGVLLLADYILMIWWAVQMAVDLNVMCGQSSRESHPSGAIVALLACLPATVAFVALTPWPALAFSSPATQAAVTRVMLPGAGVLYLICFVAGYAALRRLGLGPALWNAMLLVPFLHWFAMHRLLKPMRQRLEEYRRSQGEVPTEGAALAVPIADVTWFLAVVPWAVVAALRLIRGSWSNYFPPCGAVLVAIFAVADVAAMEGFQRRFTAALRRQGLPPRP